jgi:hypothetical protein
MNQISADSRIQNRFSALGYRSSIMDSRRTKVGNAMKLQRRLGTLQIHDNLYYQQLRGGRAARSPDTSRRHGGSNSFNTEAKVLAGRKRFDAS